MKGREQGSAGEQSNAGKKGRYGGERNGDYLPAIHCQPGLPAADEEKVGGDGAALQVFGGVPGGAVGVADRDEVNPAEGAYVMHPDVGVAQAVAAGLSSQFKGFGDVIRWHPGGKDACFGRDAVDGDLDGLDGRRVQMVEHQVKTLCGTGLFAVAGAHEMTGCLTAGEEAYGASCVVQTVCVKNERVCGRSRGGGIFEDKGRIARRLGEGEGACEEEEERDGEATHTNLPGFPKYGVPAYTKSLLLRCTRFNGSCGRRIQPICCVFEDFR